jgi:hypothetical protein
MASKGLFRLIVIIKKRVESVFQIAVNFAFFGVVVHGHLLF